MELPLIAACQMFLIPSTILFGALGVASTEGLKTLIAVMGMATSGVWFVRLCLWTGLDPVDRYTVMLLAGTFVAAWVLSFCVHLYWGCKLGFGTVELKK